MPVHRWKDLKHKTSAIRRAELRRWAQEEATRLSQNEIAPQSPPEKRAPSKRAK